MSGSNERRVRLPKEPSSERRVGTRFPLNLEVRYAVSEGHRLTRFAGVGRTLDLSSTGLRFIADSPLPIGLTLDLAINWPAVLDQGIPLQLMAFGVVVRTRGTETAIQVRRYEFRTRSAAGDLPTVFSRASQ